MSLSLCVRKQSTPKKIRGQDPHGVVGLGWVGLGWVGRVFTNPLYQMFCKLRNIANTLVFHIPHNLMPPTPHSEYYILEPWDRQGHVPLAQDKDLLVLAPGRTHPTDGIL